MKELMKELKVWFEENYKDPYEIMSFDESIYINVYDEDDLDYDLCYEITYMSTPEFHLDSGTEDQKYIISFEHMFFESHGVDTIEDIIKVLT